MRRVTLNLFRLFLLLGATCAVALTGCGGHDREPVHGTVTIDGQPLAEGQIVFTPKPGTASPTAGAMIKDGSYKVSTTNEKFVGAFRVEITASRPDGRTVKGPRGETIEGMSNYIPARFNTASELSAEVTASGPNQFNFPLQSK